MSDDAALLALIDRMLWTTALVAAPILIASLAVGLVVGLVQAATSVNEQTLTFVPKLMVMGVVLLLSMPMIGRAMADFTHIVADHIVKP